MTKNDAVLVNQVYLIFNRPFFSGQQCVYTCNYMYFSFKVFDLYIYE